MSFIEKVCSWGQTLPGAGDCGRTKNVKGRTIFKQPTGLLAEGYN